MCAVQQFTFAPERESYNAVPLICRLSLPKRHTHTMPDSAPSPQVTPPHRIVIEGVTLQGRAFRPSDWAERLCGIMSTFGGDHQMRYSPHVRPVRLDGVTCVVVEPKLKEIEPRAYRFLLDFAADNELVVFDPTAPAADDYCPVPGSVLDGLSG